MSTLEKLNVAGGSLKQVCTEMEHNPANETQLRLAKAIPIFVDQVTEAFQTVLAISPVQTSAPPSTETGQTGANTQAAAAS